MTSAPQLTQKLQAVRAAAAGTQFLLRVAACVSEWPLFNSLLHDRYVSRKAFSAHWLLRPKESMPLHWIPPNARSAPQLLRRKQPLHWQEGVLSALAVQAEEIFSSNFPDATPHRGGECPGRWLPRLKKRLAPLPLDPSTSHSANSCCGGALRRYRGRKAVHCAATAAERRPRCAGCPG